MPFAIADVVIVKSIGKTGRVVETGRAGRYRVRVGGVVMACREADLEPAAAADRRRGKSRTRLETGLDTAQAAARNALPPSRSERHGLGSLDLHGCTVEEALAKVEDRLDRALRANLDTIDIIHGRGSGRIKVAVHRLLRELPAVRHFEVASDNPGVTRVFF